MSTLRNSPGRHRRHLAGIVAGVTLLVGACSGSSAEMPTNAAVDTTSSPPTTTTLETPTTAMPASTTTFPPTTTTTVVADTEAPAMAEAGGWQRVPEDPDRDFRSRSMDAVAAGDEVVVAVGYIDHEGTIWSSPDGRTWTAAELPSPPEGQVDQILDIVTHGSGFVAVGHSGERDGSNGPFLWSSPTVWVSDDGLVWDRVDAIGDRPEPLQQVFAVASRDGMLVAVGANRSDGSAGPLAWTSRDGRTWSSIPTAAFGEFGGGETPILFDVIGSRDGFIAVGSDWNRPMPWIWRSQDGDTWDEVPSVLIEPGSDFSVMYRVTETPNGFILISRENPFSQPDMWTSTDAVEWRLVPGPADSEEAQYAGLTTSGAGVVVVGTDNFLGTVWTSLDGETWVQSPPDTEVFGTGSTVIRDATTFKDRIVAVGSSVGDHAVWLGPRHAIDNDFAAP